MENKVCIKRANESCHQDDATCEDPMVPITPRPKSERLVLGLDDSPSPFQSPNHVFDPFAPLDNLNFAPHCFKSKPQLSVVRELIFNLDSKFDPSVEDELVLESIYSSVLDVIMSAQTKENGFRTPTPPRLTHTCPLAPVKISKRRRTTTIDNKKRRKLEF